MKIENLIKTKALPSFCTANIDVLKSIMFFCNLKKLPCLMSAHLIKLTRMEDIQKKHQKKFIKEIFSLRKKIKLNKNQLFMAVTT